MKTVDQKGFTLTEALVAVTIFSGVVISTAPIIQTSLKSTTRISSNASRSEELRTASMLLRSKLSSAVYPGSKIVEHGFIGSVYNFSLLSVERAQKDPVKISFSLTRTGNDWTLKAEQNAFDKTKTTANVLGNLVNPSFSFYGRTSKSENLYWHTQWPGPQSPQLVRIEGKIQVGKKQTPFKLIANIGGQAPLLCSYDPVSRICRGEI